jgi:aspartate-semialdehyde dehydrogenase
MANLREPKVAIVGATGAVGNQLVELIGARGFPFAELKLFATESGAAETIADSSGEDRLIEALHAPADLREFDMAFLAIPAPRAAEIVEAQPGPLLIDLSAASQPPGDAPIVAPGLTTREHLESLRASATFAVPHPVAHTLAACIREIDPGSRFIAATAALGASAAGRRAIAAAVEQTTELLSARLDLEEDEVQTGFNMFVRESQRGLAVAISAQTDRLLGSHCELSLQVVAVPILHGSGLMIALAAADEYERMVAALQSAPGLLMQEPGEPLGVIDAVGQEAIIVSAERAGPGLALWCVFDNARLAALDALWIAETLARSPSTLA